MGIRCRCIRVGSSDMDALRTDATTFVFSFDVDHLGGDPAQDKAIGIEKTWHALSHLLEKSSGPSADIFFTGAPLAEDCGYSPPLFLDTDLVRSTTALLNRTPSRTLLAHYNAQAMQKAEIYPGTWDAADDEFNLQWLRGHYEKLVTFCNTAAASGDAMLLALT
ncbi:YfbM family protein [Actinomadura sp. BRA 177]|uniref:YfbM family protein n=1 Tax=Actinomadura sp. BRA 177 TaxID=2745202 RepID=UPI001595FF71|nr:YfbM family protein [Actinomadura sp. BRA 177]NVI89554.1 YfbM family protein [Actinomadura sp. BRA 177]